MSAADLPSPPPFPQLLAGEPLSLFLDFDGTLTDIAPTPDSIVVPQDLAVRLARLADRLDGRLALVSGRAIGDLERHCGPLGVFCAGSHGADRRGAAGNQMGAAPAAFPPELLLKVAAFAQEHDVELERKEHGAALHTRANPALEGMAGEFLTAMADEHGLCIKRGKQVVELVRPGSDKGAAVQAFMTITPFAGSRPVFVGDDITDEDGFAAADELGGFGVAVGSRPDTAARYELADPAAVFQWLAL